MNWRAALSRTSAAGEETIVNADRVACAFDKPSPRSHTGVPVYGRASRPSSAESLMLSRRPLNRMKGRRLGFERAARRNLRSTTAMGELSVFRGVGETCPTRNDECGR